MSTKTESILKTTTQVIIYNEYEFTARDLDALTTIRDVLYIKEGAEVGETIERYLKKEHSIASITGNTWQVEGYDKTGAVMRKTIIKEMTSDRSSEYKNEEYPIMDES